MAVEGVVGELEAHVAVALEGAGRVEAGVFAQRRVQLALVDVCMCETALMQGD